MKTFLAAWFGTLILGWVALSIFGALFDSMGFLLLGVTVIALLITVIASLSEEVDSLRKRVKRLEDRLSPEVREPQTDQSGQME